ncbi:MAG: CTP-dependent riboflavin kinase [Candidatus Thalassarchaeaceae archaeon]|nr:CTP-dependent riboflavin kinase [Candidatus Thalassarchaeaceae archaeon]
MRLSGHVSSGLGRAHIFMAQPHYQDQFRAVLGNTAWPGTLNIKVSGDDLVKYVALRRHSGIDTPDLEVTIHDGVENVNLDNIESIRIRGFLREGRSFGGATSFTSTISNKGENERLPCSILIPDLTRHVDVVEVIAIEFLREHLNLKDGDLVNLEIN